MKLTKQYIIRQSKIQVIKELDPNHNGEHLMMETFQNKIGVNIHVDLKKVIQLFGKSMKENFGRIIMHEYEQTVKMESMKKQENLINSQILG